MVQSTAAVQGEACTICIHDLTTTRSAGLLAQRQEAALKESAAAKASQAEVSAGAITQREALLRAEQARKAAEQRAVRPGRT